MGQLLSIARMVGRGVGNLELEGVGKWQLVD